MIYLAALGRMKVLKSSKHKYYEALERQTTAERVFEKKYPGGATMLGNINKPESKDINEVYQELGVKIFNALNNCLDFMGNIGTKGTQNPSREADSLPNNETLISLENLLRNLTEKIDRWEVQLNSIDAGIRRIDRYTMDAFRNIEDLKVMGISGLEQTIDNSILKGRLAKEEAAEIALETGKRMKQQGKRLTLASVAREAGLKYGQIVYAFGNKEGFFNQLEKELMALQESNPLDIEAV
jgi:hypothetical protein